MVMHPLSDKEKTENEEACQKLGRLVMEAKEQTITNDQKLADQILSLIKSSIPELKVLSDEEIERAYEKGFDMPVKAYNLTEEIEQKRFEGRKLIAQAQVKDCERQLREAQLASDKKMEEK